MAPTIAIISFALLITGGYATNYCKPGLCPPNTVNIGCNNTGQFSIQCKSPKLINLTLSLRSILLDKHNRQRDNLACGLVVGSGGKYFEQARRMPLLKWNSELASQASRNVKQCSLQGDSCRNTDQFKHAGQIVGYRFTPDPLTAKIIRALIISIIDEWYNRCRYITQKEMDSYSPNTSGYCTAMMQDRAADMGCAVSTFIQIQFGRKINTLQMTCNYAFSNVKLNFPVYVKGLVASKCTTGRDSKYTGLCSKKEYINSNP